MNTFLKTVQPTKWTKSIKGFQIHNEKMYISYIEEKSPSCALGILFGDISFDDIKFES